eukprot:TRINITY_DN30118_c0_g1_i1.p1 TRINITY_DN30118_c0_g1~~TRINITY_DN30118_c0_g1_i1.p1  ORF type:complete len:273 (-),score=38.52 TRINITY_DN30118_c0_g1_i1:123-887(-)
MDTKRYHSVSINDQPKYLTFCLSFCDTLLEQLLVLFTEPASLNNVTFLKSLQVMVHFTMYRPAQVIFDFAQQDVQRQQMVLKLYGLHPFLKENMLLLLSFPSLLDDSLWKANLRVFYKRILHIEIESPPIDLSMLTPGNSHWIYLGIRNAPKGTIVHALNVEDGGLDYYNYTQLLNVIFVKEVFSENQDMYFFFVSICFFLFYFLSSFLKWFWQFFFMDPVKMINEGEKQKASFPINLTGASRFRFLLYFAQLV